MKPRVAIAAVAPLTKFVLFLELVNLIFLLTFNTSVDEKFPLDVLADDLKL
jgi:hypothetical protein